MKKTLFSILNVAALLVVGCTNNEVDDVVNTATSKTVTIEVVNDATRLDWSDTNGIAWSEVAAEKEKMAFAFNVAGDATKAATLAIADKKATFTVDVPDGANKIWPFYPMSAKRVDNAAELSVAIEIPVAQTQAVAGVMSDVDNKVAFMTDEPIAIPAAGSISGVVLKPVNTILRFFIYGKTGEKVQSVKFEADKNVNGYSHFIHNYGNTSINNDFGANGQLYGTVTLTTPFDVPADQAASQGYGVYMGIRPVTTTGYTYTVTTDTNTYTFNSVAEKTYKAGAIYNVYLNLNKSVNYVLAVNLSDGIEIPQAGATNLEVGSVDIGGADDYNNVVITSATATATVDNNGKIYVTAAETTNEKNHEFSVTYHDKNTEFNIHQIGAVSNEVTFAYNAFNSFDNVSGEGDTVQTAGINYIKVGETYLIKDGNKTDKFNGAIIIRAEADDAWVTFTGANSNFINTDNYCIGIKVAKNPTTSPRSTNIRLMVDGTLSTNGFPVNQLAGSGDAGGEPEGPAVGTELWTNDHTYTPTYYCSQGESWGSIADWANTLEGATFSYNAAHLYYQYATVSGNYWYNQFRITTDINIPAGTKVVFSCDITCTQPNNWTYKCENGTLGDQQYNQTFTDFDNNTNKYNYHLSQAFVAPSGGITGFQFLFGFGGNLADTTIDITNMSLVVSE